MSDNKKIPSSKSLDPGAKEFVQTNVDANKADANKADANKADANKADEYNNSVTSLDKSTSEKLMILTSNVTIITKNIRERLLKLRASLQNDKQALDELDNVINILHTISEESEETTQNSTEIESIVNTFFNDINAGKSFDYKYCNTVLMPLFPSIIRNAKNGTPEIKKAAEFQYSSTPERQKAIEQSKKLQTMLPLIKEGLIVKLKNIEDAKKTPAITAIIAGLEKNSLINFYDKLLKALLGMEPSTTAKGGKSYKTAKNQFSNLMSYIPGMSKKTQKKHRKH